MSGDLHTLTGAYAADALSETERLAFERHLDAVSYTHLTLPTKA